MKNCRNTNQKNWIAEKVHHHWFLDGGGSGFLIKVVTLLGIGKGCKSEVWINFDTVEAEKFRKNLLCSMVVVICELDD